MFLLLRRSPADKVVDDVDQSGEVLVGVLLSRGEFSLSLRKLLGGVVKEHLRLE